MAPFGNVGPVQTLANGPGANKTPRLNISAVPEESLEKIFSEREDRAIAALHFDVQNCIRRRLAL
jgi:hypothetical protein